MKIVEFRMSNGKLEFRCLLAKNKSETIKTMDDEYTEYSLELTDEYSDWEPVQIVD